MDDKKLLRLLDRQPNEALARILGEYGGLLNGIAMNILRDPRDAEECVSDALVGLWKSRDRVQDPERLKSYLCAITRNAALDRLRKKGARELSLQQELTEDYPLAGREDELLLTELVTGAIASLGEPTATIFLQRYYQELSLGEIARENQMTVRAVESRLYRGKQKLKEILSEEGTFYEA